MNRAPDAKEHAERPIGFAYDGKMQGHVAILHEHVGPGESKQTRICYLHDGKESHYKADIELLKSWGEIMASHPVRDGIWHGVGLGLWEYRLHDTPMVRALLRKIDGEHCTRLSLQLESLLKEANERGYIIGSYSPSQDREWKELPKDIRCHIYKNYKAK